MIRLRAGVLEEVFRTRKPLTRIISANNSAASASSSMIRTVFSGDVMNCFSFDNNSIRQMNSQEDESELQGQTSEFLF
jgi:hypothetical protein